MPQYAPTNLSPEFVSLDATKAITFIWTPQGLAQSAFQLFIYKNSDNSLLYTSTKTTSSVGSFTLPVNTLTNGLEVYWKVNVYKDSTNYVTSENILFKTALAPTVTMGTLPSTSQNYLFTATYTIDSSTSIQKFRWYLYDNFNSLVNDSGDVFGYNVQYQFNGLISGFIYKTECVVTDQNGQSGSSGKVTFTTTYTSPSPVSLFTVTSIDNTGAIKIDFSQINQTKGTLFGTGSYVDGKFSLGLSLNKNSYVEFIKTISTTFTYTYYVKLPTDFNGDIVRFGNNEYVIFYDGKKFGYRFDNFITCGKNRTLPSDEFIKIAFKYGKVIVQTLSYTEIIF